MRQAPPLAFLVALIPVSTDAGLAGPAIVEEDGNPALLGPAHDVLPFARMEAALADVVLDLILWMLALEVLDLAEEDQALFLVDLGHLHQNDMGGILDDKAQRMWGFHVA